MSAGSVALLSGRSCFRKSNLPFGSEHAPYFARAPRAILLSSSYLSVHELSSHKSSLLSTGNTLSGVVSHPTGSRLSSSETRSF